MALSPGTAKRRPNPLMRYFVSAADDAIAQQYTERLRTAGVDVVDLVGSLRNEDPRIFVGSDVLDESAFTINPLCLSDEEADYLVERVLSYVA